MKTIVAAIFLFFNCLVRGDPDQKEGLRLSEIQLNVDKRSSFTTFNNIEIWSPNSTLTPTGVTAVIFAGSSSSSIKTCPCDNAVFTTTNYALCDCGLSFKTIEFVGAIALYNNDQASFPDGTPVSATMNFDLLDVILWQSTGPLLLPNPMQQHGYFAAGQVFHYQPPTDSEAYSINRCYGDKLLTGQWQASYTLSITATPGQPNDCGKPTVNVNEINFNKAFIELQTDPLELPLDNVTLASIDQNGNVIDYAQLINLRANSNSYFTIGRAPSDVLKPNWALPMAGQTAIAAYYETDVVIGETAPTSNILSSIVYSPTETTTTVDSLKVFGTTAYKADSTGTCSLCNCNGTVQACLPTLGQANDCSSPCVVALSRK